MRNRLRIAVLIYSMTNAVIFGAAIYGVECARTQRQRLHFEGVKWCQPKLTVRVKHLAGSRMLRHATVRDFGQH